MGDITEEVKTSWGSRLGDSIKGIFVGIIIFLLAFPLLFWNEGNSVKQYKSLSEGSGLVVSVPSDKVDATNDGKLVHTSGTAKTAQMLQDNMFNISANAIKLKRNVEIFQWKEDAKKETKKEVGGSTTEKTTYSYSKVWSDSLINSSKFKDAVNYKNPAVMPYKSEEFVASDVKLGAYTLPSSLVTRIDKYQPLTVAPTQLPSIPNSKVEAGGFYIGLSSANPQVGDMKITFKQVPSQDISIVSKQIGSTFDAYQTKAGGTIQLLEYGVVAADKMFKQAQDANVAMTWVFRVIGFLLMFGGVSLVLKPMSVLADVLPFLGNLVEKGIGLIAFIVAIIFASLTIAIAWIVARPLIGIILLLISIALGVGITVMSLKLKKA